MKRELVAVLMGLAVGLLVGLAWQGHRAAEAEAKAHTADSLYHVTAGRERIAQRDRVLFDRLRQEAQDEADRIAQEADDSLAAVRARAAKTTARVGLALAAAATIRDTAETYKALYEERSSQLEGALAAAENQRRAVGRLQAMLAADTVEIRKERGRTAEWQRTAEVLQMANAELMAHRRPEFGWKFGVGGLAVGAVAAELVRAVVTP